jgi:hypothetical protein
VAEDDPIVAAAFNDVADLLAPPQNIMRPGVLWRVLRGRRRPPAPAAGPPAGALQRSAIVQAMSARSMRLRSTTDADDSPTSPGTQSAGPRS